MVSRIRPVVLPQPAAAAMVLATATPASSAPAMHADVFARRSRTRAHCPHPTASVPASQRPAIDTGAPPSTRPSTERSTCPASTPASTTTCGRPDADAGVGDRPGPGPGQRAAARAAGVGGRPRQAREAEPAARAEIQRCASAAQGERRAQRRAPGRGAHRADSAVGVGVGARLGELERRRPGRPLVSPRSIHRRAKVQPRRSPPPHASPRPENGPAACATTSARAAPPSRPRAPQRAILGGAPQLHRSPAGDGGGWNGRALGARAHGQLHPAGDHQLGGAQRHRARRDGAAALRGQVHGARELLAGDRIDDRGLHRGAVAGDADLGDAAFGEDEDEDGDDGTILASSSSAARRRTSSRGSAGQRSISRLISGDGPAAFAGAAIPAVRTATTIAAASAPRRFMVSPAGPRIA